MTPERWQQVDQLYHSALEREPEQRGVFLAEACAEDEELRREVESLLAHEGPPLDRPAWEGAADLLDGPTRTQLVPGTQLGPYRIEAALGAGGMGEVYRAVDTRLKRTVAIKIAKENFGERFEREARAIAALNHPNICTLHDVGPNYLVMEFIEGPTLAERIQQGPVPLEKALGIARQIADALEAAHEKGVVHRDLKPGNVKIKPDDTVKVLDFGLAKVAPVLDGDSQDDTASLTTRGMILGTAAYMSPEQAQGKAVDKRADIWAFGLVLYEMLTGQRVFRGETASDTMAAVLTKEPEWERVPAKVQRLLKRCLEKDPQKRLRDISGVELLLEDTPQGMPLRHSRVPWAVAAALAAGVAIWGWLHTPPAEPRPVTRWSAALPASEALNGSGLAISRDGTRLAYAEQTGGSSRIWVRMLDQPDGKPIQGTDGGLRPFFSPDGQWLAYFTSPSGIGPLKKVPLMGGPPITLCDGAGPVGGTWGEDGSIIFMGSSGGLTRVSASGGACENLTRADRQRREIHRWPQLLPGGQAVLFTIGIGGTSFDGARIAVLDLKSGGIRVLVNGASAARYVPTGHLVYVRGGTMFAVPFDLKRLVVTGPETPAIEGVYYNSNGGFADYTFSDSGLLLYMAETRTTEETLEWLDRKGVEQALPAPPQRYRGVRLSPDGRYVAVAMVIVGRAVRIDDIWIYELARGTLTRLTASGFNDNPVWTPDGRRVAFSTRKNPDGWIQWAPADGSGRPEQLLPSQAMASPDSWTPDGKMLLYHSGTPAHIWTLPVTGSGGESKPRPFSETSFNEFDAQVSPDGRWVAYTSDESGKNQVYARPFPGPGGKTSISIGGGQEPRWSRAGRELFYRDAGKNQLMAVDIQTSPAFRAGQPRALFELRTGNWDVAPDGKRFLVVKEPRTVAGEAKMEAVVNWFEELRQKTGKK
jgi:Tol biopolymer transport system component/predicted Ser/Thr protein kinase